MAEGSPLLVARLSSPAASPSSPPRTTPGLQGFTAAEQQMFAWVSKCDVHPVHDDAVSLDSIGRANASIGQALHPFSENERRKKLWLRHNLPVAVQSEKDVSNGFPLLACFVEWTSSNTKATVRLIFEGDGCYSRLNPSEPFKLGTFISRSVKFAKAGRTADIKTLQYRNVDLSVFCDAPVPVPISAPGLSNATAQTHNDRKEDKNAASTNQVPAAHLPFNSPQPPPLCPRQGSRIFLTALSSPQLVTVPQQPRLPWKSIASADLCGPQSWSLGVNFQLGARFAGEVPLEMWLPANQYFASPGELVDKQQTDMASSSASATATAATTAMSITATTAATAATATAPTTATTTAAAAPSLGASFASTTACPPHQETGQALPSVSAVVRDSSCAMPLPPLPSLPSCLVSNNSAAILSWRPILFLNTQNHLFGPVDHNPFLTKVMWTQYYVFEGGEREAVEFCKRHVQAKPNLFTPLRKLFVKHDASLADIVFTPLTGVWEETVCSEDSKKQCL